MKCHICQDTGFYKGKICVCITNPKKDFPENDAFNDLLNMFGMMDKKKDNK